MRPVLVCVALLLVAGCDVFSGSSEPEYRRVPGELVVGDPSAPTISVPNQIHPGVPVSITVTTEVGGCRKPGEDTEVAFVAGAVEIRPYDQVVVRQDVFCASVSIYHQHTVSVTFPEAGPILVRAVGQTPVILADGSVGAETQTRELGIVVR